MSNKDTASADQTSASTERQDTPRQPGFFRKYRKSFLIIGGLAIVIAGATTSWLLLEQTQKKQQAASPKVQTTQQPATATKKPTNSWKSSVSSTAIPLGDGHVSTTPQAGYIMSCTTNFRGGGAMHTGSWINAADNTWNADTKVAVSGSVAWEQASYSVSTSGDNRVINTNDLPVSDKTGTFPIASSDPAWQYDRNPNSIAANNTVYTLPLNPAAAATPSCTDLGAIGVMTNGVFLFNGLDAAGRDAVAHETQDSCSGHPDGQEDYHYHDVPSCIMSRATGESTLVGYALDGFGIYVERDSNGNLPTNADLDECHGRTSEVMWNGATTNIYHYDATLEYPFTIGCYHGTPIKTNHR